LIKIQVQIIKVSVICFVLRGQMIGPLPNPQPGRPKTTWRKTAEREREKAGWKNRSEVQIAAAYRAGWRDCVEALCATWHKEDR